MRPGIIVAVLDSLSAARDAAVKKALSLAAVDECAVPVAVDGGAVTRVAAGAALPQGVAS